MEIEPEKPENSATTEIQVNQYMGNGNEIEEEADEEAPPLSTQEETKEETKEQAKEETKEETKGEVTLKEEEAAIGKCDFCYNFRRLLYPCVCEQIGYCSENCRERDKLYHKNCPGKIHREVGDVFDPEKPYYKLKFKSNANVGTDTDCALCGERYCNSCDLDINDEMTLGLIQEKLADQKLELEIYFENAPSFINLQKTSNACKNFREKYPNKKILGYAETDDEEETKQKEEDEE